MESWRPDGTLEYPPSMSMPPGRIADLVKQGVDSPPSASCIAYANPPRTRHRLAGCPGASRTLVAHLSPLILPSLSSGSQHLKIREYLRAHATVANAFVSAAARSPERLERRCANDAIRGRALLMLSTGGLTQCSEAKRRAGASCWKRCPPPARWPVAWFGAETPVCARVLALTWRQRPPTCPGGTEGEPRSAYGFRVGRREAFFCACRRLGFRTRSPHRLS